MKNISFVFKLAERISSKLSEKKIAEPFAVLMNKRYLNAIQNFLNKNYKYLLNSTPSSEKSSQQYEKILWVCWFQGYEKAHF